MMFMGKHSFGVLWCCGCAFPLIPPLRFFFAKINPKMGSAAAFGHLVV